MAKLGIRDVIIKPTLMFRQGVLSTSEKQRWLGPFPHEAFSSGTLRNSLTEDYDLLKDTQLVRGGARAGL